jgi:hypothetical protein
MISWDMGIPNPKIRGGLTWRKWMGFCGFPLTPSKMKNEGVIRRRIRGVVKMIALAK